MALDVKFEHDTAPSILEESKVQENEDAFELLGALRDANFGPTDWDQVALEYELEAWEWR